MRPLLNPLSLAALALGIAALATPRAARAQSITSFDWNQPVALKLVDGRRIAGRYHGTLGSPSTAGPYAERYASWRSELGPDQAPARRDSLVVFRSASEGMLHGRFRGIAGGALLLGTVDSCVYMVVPLKKIAAVRLAEYADADSIWTGVEQRWKAAPTEYATVLQTEFETLAVPDEFVTAMKTENGSGGSGGGAAAIVVLAVIAGAAIGYYAAAAAIASAFSHALW